MNDSITVPRESLEMLLKAASSILDKTEPIAPEDVGRTEIRIKNHQRKGLTEAVFQAEKALYESDSKPLTAEQMSVNANNRRKNEDNFSYDKANFIEGRR